MFLTELFLARFVTWGAEWVLWLLVALSVVSIAVMIERVMYYRAHRVDVDALTEALRGGFRDGEHERVFKLVRGSDAIECAVVAAGLEVVDRGPRAVSESMAAAKARQRHRLESNLAVLGTLGNNAPFIGLLGTVLGIIKAAHDLSVAQGGQQAAAGAVMAGVFESLVATAVGLFVAIPAVIAYNIFQRRVRATLARADALAHLLLSQVANQSPESAELASASQRS